MLDQFYTERETARRCWLELEQALDELGVKSHAPFFVEPSAGDGAFYDLLPPDRRVGFDIEPRHPEVQEKDFLFYFDYRPPTGREHTVIVGNPPFGDRGRLAVQFFRQAAELFGENDMDAIAAAGGCGAGGWLFAHRFGAGRVLRHRWLSD